MRTSKNPKYHTITFRVQTEYIMMLDEINKSLIFQSSYSEIIRSLIRTYYLSIMNDVHIQEIQDNIEYEVIEGKFTNPDK